jgi:hypothetical protein
MPRRVIDQHRGVAIRRCEIAGGDCQGARRLTQRVAQRQRMLDRERVVDGAVDSSHGLVGESLQPEHSRERDPRRDPLVELKAHDVRSIQRSDITLQHALDVAARPRLLSQEV